MTFENIFEKYPQVVDKELTISFLEDLREGIFSSSNYGMWDDEFKSDLKHPDLYDWSWLDNYEEPQLWWIESLAESLKAEIKEKCKDCKTLDEKIDKVNEEVSKCWPARWEH